jgi:hypothetical protein
MLRLYLCLKKESNELIYSKLLQRGSAYFLVKNAMMNLNLSPLVVKQSVLVNRIKKL